MVWWAMGDQCSKQKLIYYNCYNYYKMGDYAMIPVHQETKEMLKSYGLKGETYDQLVRKLLSIADHAQIMETHYQRLGEKDEFVSLEDL